MDTFFHLLAMYDCCPIGSTNGFVLIAKGRDFGGPFPVSRRGLAALVRDSKGSRHAGADGASRHRRRRRSYHLNKFGLSSDKWDCIFRSCDGPDVQLQFFCFAYAEFPDAIRGLMSALQEDRCRAAIFVIGVEYLPPSVFQEFLEALERNRSVAEVALNIENGGTEDDNAAVDDTALHGLLDSLVRRRYRLDVLELHVPAFTQRTWDQLWTDVVPSSALNVRRLVLRTGAERGHRRDAQERDGGEVR